MLFHNLQRPICPFSTYTGPPGLIGHDLGIVGRLMIIVGVLHTDVIANDAEGKNSPSPLFN